MTDTLYVNGCSWSQGYLLHEDPIVKSYAEGLGYEFLSDFRVKLHGEFVSDAYQPIYDEFNWAGVLRRQLSIPKLVNHSLGAGSNARILRTTLDYVKSLSAEQRSETLVVIGWTLPDRGELYLDDRSGTQRWELFNAAQPWDTLTPPQIYAPEFRQRMTEFWRRYVADIHSNYACVKLFFQQSYLLANTLENLGIPYFFFNTFPVFWGLDDPVQLESFSTDVDQYHHELSVMPVGHCFADQVNGKPEYLLSDGHPNSQGYKLWADTLRTAITQRGLV
jgi:hypothetical protein